MSSEHSVVVNLESKIWYRFGKVVYVGLFLLGTGISLLISLYVIPNNNIDYNRSTIKCDNGKLFTIGNKAQFTSSGTFNDSDANSICGNTDSDGNLIVSQKYSVTLVNYPTDYRFLRIIVSFLIGTFIIGVILEIVRRVSLYILVGKY